MTANWTEPKATVHGYHDRYASFSVGFTTSGGLQGGTNADSIGGVPHYYAWYINQRTGVTTVFRNPVRPGDHLSILITVRKTSIYNLRATLRLTDVRHRRHQRPLRWTRSVHLNNADYGIASIAGVAPNDGSSTGPLTDFHRVYFTDVKINGRVVGSYQSAHSTDLVATGPYGSDTLAKTSSLGSDGDSFHITWKRGS